MSKTKKIPLNKVIKKTEFIEKKLNFLTILESQHAIQKIDIINTDNFRFLHTVCGESLLSVHTLIIIICLNSIMQLY